MFSLYNTVHVIKLPLVLGYVQKYICTVQAATVLPPGCVLSRALTYIQMGLITTTFHRKIGTFEVVCERLRPSWSNN